MTVAELKLELTKREVHCPSKLRKKEVHALLLDSMHLPVDPNKEAPVKKSYEEQEEQAKVRVGNQMILLGCFSILN